MNFSAEELLPVVGKLAEKYTGWESTSITYEKAEQLMEAVLYCIREMDGQKEGLVSQEKMSAELAYEQGYQCVVEKVKETLDLYHKILSDFSFYENRCLRDCFVGHCEENGGRGGPDGRAGNQGFSPKCRSWTGAGVLWGRRGFV